MASRSGDGVGGGGGRKGKEKEFNLDALEKLETITEYDSTKDPYNPFTKRPEFARHMAQQAELEKAEMIERRRAGLSKSAPLLEEPTAFEITPSMKPMERPVITIEKFPKHSVPNTRFVILSTVSSVSLTLAPQQ
jgi:hypothetical protein